MRVNRFGEIMEVVSFLKKFLLLFNYSCVPFLPSPPPHPTPAEPPSLPHYRNYYKGHMDKIKGEGGGGGGRRVLLGGVEGWGEKAYNYN